VQQSGVVLLLAGVEVKELGLRELGLFLAEQLSVPLDCIFDRMSLLIEGCKNKWSLAFFIFAVRI